VAFYEAACASLAIRSRHKPFVALLHLGFTVIISSAIFIDSLRLSFRFDALSVF
jgi:hypothetical protein